MIRANRFARIALRITRATKVQMFADFRLALLLTGSGNQGVWGSQIFAGKRRFLAEASICCLPS